MLNVFGKLSSVSHDLVFHGNKYCSNTGTVGGTHTTQRCHEFIAHMGKGDMFKWGLENILQNFVNDL